MTLPLVTDLSLLNCPHAVPVTLVASVAKVMIEGGRPLTAGDRGMIAGCPFTVPTGKPQPCATALFTLTASKVFIEGKPAVLTNPADLCHSADQIPNGPVVWATVQAKVLAS